MKEPVPGRIGPPNSGVPLLKVGVVLEEDEKTTISFQVQEPIYVASCGDRSIPLEPKEEYLIEHDSGSLALYLENTLLFPSSDTTIAVSAEQELELAPHSGIRANGLVAGRSFHWKKTIEQTFPGSLNFLPGYSSIVAINEVEFEDYLACVISSEMSSQCPAEFVKAQATAARCWAYVFLQNKHPEAPFDICNDDDCQRYQGTGNLTQSAISAVRDSRGLFVLDASQNVCPTYYSKSCGGVMEGSQTAFGFEVKGLCDQLDGSGVTPLDLTIEEGVRKWVDEWKSLGGEIYCSPAVVSEQDLPKYLGAVDEPREYFRWEYSVSGNQVISNLREKFNLPDADKLIDLEFGLRGSSGRYVSAQLHYLDSSGSRKSFELINQYQIRQAFHPSFLFSSAFYIAHEERNHGEISSLTLRGGGWGHGVGLCQIGALGMALSGLSHEAILAHYYPGCELKKVY